MNKCEICEHETTTNKTICNVCLLAFTNQDDGLMLEGIGLADQLLRVIALGDDAGLMLSGFIQRMKYHEKEAECCKQNTEGSDYDVEYSEYLTIRGLRALMEAHANSLNQEEL